MIGLCICPLKPQFPCVTAEEQRPIQWALKTDMSDIYSSQWDVNPHQAPWLSTSQSMNLIYFLWATGALFTSSQLRDWASVSPSPKPAACQRYLKYLKCCFWFGDVLWGCLIMVWCHCLLQHCSSVFVRQKESRECPGELQTAIQPGKHLK